MTTPATDPSNFQQPAPGALGARIMAVLADWNRFSESPDRLTRLFLTASNKFLDSLTPEQRDAILAAGKEAEQIHAAKMEKMIEDLSGKLKEQGMEIVENPDVSGFQEKAKQVHEKYKGVIGADVLEAVQKM